MPVAPLLAGRGAANGPCHKHTHYNNTRQGGCPLLLGLGGDARLPPRPFRAQTCAHVATVRRSISALAAHAPRRSPPPQPGAASGGARLMPRPRLHRGLKDQPDLGRHRWGCHTSCSLAGMWLMGDRRHKSSRPSPVPTRALVALITAAPPLDCQSLRCASPSPFRCSVCLVLAITPLAASAVAMFLDRGLQMLLLPSLRQSVPMPRA